MQETLIQIGICVVSVPVAYMIIKKSGFQKVPSNNLSRFIKKEKKINESITKSTKGGFFS